MNEDRLLIAQAEDLISRCGRQDIPVCSEFLDERQQSLLRQNFGTKQGDVDIIYYGGYKEADRVVMACLPYWMAEVTGGRFSCHLNTEDDTRTVPLSSFLTVIRAAVPKGSAASGKGRALSHGDYLGAVMGLGIRRSVIGDILVTDDGADIIVLREIAEYMLHNLTGAGKAHITAEEVPLPELRTPKAAYTEYTDTVASLRLDAVLAAAFRISRGKAAEAVKQGSVFVDHLEAAGPDMNVKEGAQLVIRHHGKVKLLEIGQRTRKNRIRITIRKYDRG